MNFSYVCGSYTCICTCVLLLHTHCIIFIYKHTHTCMAIYIHVCMYLLLLPIETEKAVGIVNCTCANWKHNKWTESNNNNQNKKWVPINNKIQIKSINVHIYQCMYVWESVTTPIKLKVISTNITQTLMLI